MLGNKKVIAVVPARGGSKRIKNKNIVDFHGKPMIAWTIEAALAVEYIDEVIVLTDSEQIASISEQYGAKIPYLRTVSEDAGDFTPISEVTANAMTKIQPILGDFDIVIQLMANCPLRTAADIQEALEAFLSNRVKSLISFFKYGFQNPWWAHQRNSNGTTERVFNDEITKRSQDLPELYCPTGSIWIAEVKELIENRTFYIKGYYSHILNWKSAIDIDDLDDLELAINAFQIRKNIVS